MLTRSAGGACAIPHPFIPASEQRRGTDCTALPGVEAVSCSAGACVVERCAAGWRIAEDGHTCVELKERIARDVESDATAAAVVEDHHEDEIVMDGTTHAHAIRTVVLDTTTRTAIVTAVVTDVHTKIAGTIDADIDALVHASLDIVAHSATYVNLDIASDVDLVSSLCADAATQVTTAVHASFDATTRAAFVASAAAAISEHIAAHDVSDVDALIRTTLVAAIRASTYAVSGPLLASLCADVRAQLTVSAHAAARALAVLDSATHDRIVAAVVSDINTNALLVSHADVDVVVRAALAAVLRSDAFTHLDVLGNTALVSSLCADSKARLSDNALSTDGILGAAHLDSVVATVVHANDSGVVLRATAEDARVELPRHMPADWAKAARAMPADWAPVTV
jgi:hypothetical protein